MDREYDAVEGRPVRNVLNLHRDRFVGEALFIARGLLSLVMLELDQIGPSFGDSSGVPIVCGMVDE